MTQHDAALDTLDGFSLQSLVDQAIKRSAKELKPLAVKSTLIRPAASASPSSAASSSSPLARHGQGLSFLLSLMDDALFQEKEGKKPVASSTGVSDAVRNPFDAFAPGRVPRSMTIGSIFGTHDVTLNKFPVRHGHMVIYTRDFVPHDGPLSAADLGSLYLLVRRMGGLGFFNSGPLSGSSQPRRHTQFIPLKTLASAYHAAIGLPEDYKAEGGVRPASPIPLDQLIGAYRAQSNWRVGRYEEPFRIPSLPFDHAVVTLGGDVFNMDISVVADHLLKVYTNACRAADVLLFDPLDLDKDVTASHEFLPDTTLKTRDHNVLLTREWMFVVPRKAAKAGPAGCAPLNALSYAGLLLIKGTDGADFVNRELVQYDGADTNATAVNASPCAVSTVPESAAAAGAVRGKEDFATKLLRILAEGAGEAE